MDRQFHNPGHGLVRGHEHGLSRPASADAIDLPGGNTQVAAPARFTKEIEDEDRADANDVVVWPRCGISLRAFA